MAKQSFHYDRWILSITFLLMFFGLLMVASSSMVVSDHQYNYPFHYLVRQAIYLLIGISLGIIATRVPLSVWQRSSTLLLVIALLLLFFVLVPGIGHVINGSRRWIYFGVLSLQVSEFVKLAALLYLSSYLERHRDQVQAHLIGFVKPMLLLGFMGLLLLLEPDFGAVFVLSAMFLSLLFLAGVRLTWFVLLLIVVLTALSFLVITSPYRLERLTSFINPWETQFGSGYQLTQSLIAFGRGGLFGVGLGNSVQKLFYLPEAHTDFLFAVIAEELGLMGALVLVLLFALLIMRIMKLARRAELKGDLFAGFVGYGTAVWLGLQGMINMGVNAGVLPTKGLTLPFISYGGSSMLINCIVIGIVLRLAHEIPGNRKVAVSTARRSSRKQSYA